MPSTTSLWRRISQYWVLFSLLLVSYLDMTRKYSRYVSERNGGCVILTNGENIAMFTNPDSGQELPTIKSFQYLFKYLITRNTGPLNQVLSLFLWCRDQLFFSTRCLSDLEPFGGPLRFDHRPFSFWSFLSSLNVTASWYFHLSIKLTSGGYFNLILVMLFDNPTSAGVLDFQVSIRSGRCGRSWISLANLRDYRELLCRNKSCRALVRNIGVDLTALQPVNDD